MIGIEPRQTSDRRSAWKDSECCRNLVLLPWEESVEAYCRLQSAGALANKEAALTLSCGPPISVSADRSARSRLGSGGKRLSFPSNRNEHPAIFPVITGLCPTRTLYLVNRVGGYLEFLFQLLYLHQHRPPICIRCKGLNTISSENIMQYFASLANLPLGTCMNIPRYKHK